MKQKNNKQDVYHDIRRRIISLELPPGTDLDEAELVQSYGVSRTPIRETLIRLQGEGLVELRRNRGAYVAPLDIPTLQSYFEAADFLHRAVVRLAAQRRTNEDLKLIKEAMEKFEAALQAENADQMVVWNDLFHFRIGQASGNKYLLNSYRRVLADHERIAALLYGHELNTQDAQTKKITLEQHRALFDAIEAKDASQAEAISSAHLNLCKSGIADLLEKSSGLLDGIMLESVEPA